MEQQQDKREIAEATPTILPKPTYMPFLFAVSLLFLGWGLISHWILSVAGFAGMCISLAGWIKALLYERRNN